MEHCAQERLPLLLHKFDVQIDKELELERAKISEEPAYSEQP
jgi:hypothetical protein